MQNIVKVVDEIRNILLVILLNIPNPTFHCHLAANRPVTTNEDSDTDGLW